MVNGLKCTDMCRLQDCENQTNAEESDYEPDEKDDLDLEDEHEY